MKKFKAGIIKNAVIVGLAGLTAFCHFYNQNYRVEATQQLKVKTDSLNELTSHLTETQSKYDSAIDHSDKKIVALNAEIKALKSRVNYVKSYYKKLQSQSKSYTPTQIDSFFKQRYNY